MTFGYRDKFKAARESAQAETPEDGRELETPEDHLEPEFTTPDQTPAGAPSAAGLEGTSPALEDAGHDDTPAGAPSADVVEAGHDSTGEEGPA